MNLKIFKIFDKKLIKDSVVYITTDILNKSIPFLLLPVLAYYLSPEDFGILAIFNSILSVFVFVIGLNVLGSISVNYYSFSKKELAQYIGNVIYILVASLVFIILIVLIFKTYLQSILEIEYLWIISAAFVSFSSSLVMLNLNLWLVEQKPKLYGIYEILETILKFSFSLFFIVIMIMAWEGRILGMLIGGAISAIISIVILNKRNYIKLEFSKKHIKEALKFGIPLIPHSMSQWLKNGAVIFLLSYYVGSKETGLYSIALQLTQVIIVLSSAFNRSWAPYLYRKLSKSPSLSEKRQIVKFTYIYFITISIVVLIIAVLTPYIIKLFFTDEYYNVNIFIVYLYIGAIFQGMYLMVVNYIFYTKQTKYLAYITFTISIINVVMSYFLINIHGPLGAAIASMISSIITFTGVWYYSNQVYKMPWTLKDI